MISDSLLPEQTLSGLNRIKTQAFRIVKLSAKLLRVTEHFYWKIFKENRDD